MLASALKKGGTSNKANEEQDAEQMVADLVKTYSERNNDSIPKSRVAASDFDVFITSKYQ